MTLARAGIVVAVAGAVALAVHVRFRAKAQQESDCAAWRRAYLTILPGGGVPGWGQPLWKWGSQWGKRPAVVTALQAPDMDALWTARVLAAYDLEWVWELLPALRDPTFVGSRNARDKRGTRFEGVRDDLSRRAGRASWLLKEVTGRDAPIVTAQSDPAFLADLADDWERWLHRLDGGAACRK